MSYIYGLAKCDICKKVVKYAWLKADLKFEKKPSSDDYVMAGHDIIDGREVILWTCPECKSNNIYFI